MADTSSLERALAALERGDALEARRIVDDAVTEAEESQGALSPQCAAARFEQAMVSAALGETEQAEIELKAAYAVPAVDDDSKELRAMLALNLGDILAGQGKLEEATEVLEEGLKIREQVSGKTSVDYAHGCEPLAAVHLALGKLGRAGALTDTASKILRAADDDRLGPVLALGATIARSHDPEAEILQDVASLRDEAFAHLVGAVFARAEMDPPDIVIGILTELEPQVRRRPGADGELLQQFLVVFASAAGEAEAPELEREKLAELRALCHADGDHEAVLQVDLTIADSHDDEAKARPRFEKARQLGAKLGPAFEAEALRRHAMYEAAADEDAAAQKLVALAVERARDSGDNAVLGECLTSSGVIAFHADNEGTARAHLTGAIEVLPPDHPGLETAHSHLDAIESGGPCGCEPQEELLEQALHALIEPQLPEGLLDGFTVNDEGVQVELLREPTPEEATLLDQLIRQTLESMGGELDE